jgi:hypothetical protein
MFRRFGVHMFKTTLLASAALAVMSGTILAQSTPSDLQQQIDALKAELAELKSQQATAATRADVDATVERVLADSAKRSQLLQLHGFTAGWTNERFVLQSEDGNFSLKPSLQWQLRHVVNLSDDGDDWEADHGFEMRRVKFAFDGNAFSKKLTYFFLWTSAINGGNAYLEHAWVKYMFNETWGVRGGQIGNPVFKEQATSSKRSLAVDRSLANVLVTDTHEAQTQAVSLLYQSKPLYVEWGYGDGFASNNTDWSLPGDWNTFVRADYIFFGDIKQMLETCAGGNKEAVLGIGGGLDITDGPDAVYYRHTADVQYEDCGKFGFYAAYLGNYQETYGGGSLYDFGFVAQAGVMVSEKWELFGRYGISFLDEVAGDEDTFNEFTVGANWFIKGHSAKFTIDLTYLPDGSPSDQKGIGIIASEEDQFVVRSQFQLLI